MNPLVFGLRTAPDGIKSFPVDLHGPIGRARLNIYLSSYLSVNDDVVESCLFIFKVGFGGRSWLRSDQIKQIIKNTIIKEF